MQTINRKKQSGVALVTALMFLVILTMLAMSSMTNTTLEEKMAANSVEINRVFQAAESGMVIASVDEDSYNLSNSEERPYVQTVSPQIGNTDTTYEVIYLEKTNPPRTGERSGLFNVEDFKAYHFNVTATATSRSNASVTLNSGVYQIGPDG